MFDTPCPSKALVISLTLAILLSLVNLLPCPAAEETRVEYLLRDSETDARTLEVTSSFSLKKGETAVMEAPATSADASETVSVELAVGDNPEFDVEPLPPPATGWTLRAKNPVEVEVPYKVHFSNQARPLDSGEASGSNGPPLAIVDDDLIVFRASDVLICPRSENNKPLSTDFLVEIRLADGEKALVPWEKADEGGSSFEVSGVTSLLENLVAWGDLDVLTVRKDDPLLTLGFSVDYQRLTADQKKQYGDSMGQLLDRLVMKMGKRPELPRLSVILCGASRFDLDSPRSSGLFSSVILYHGGSKLEGDSSAVAASGLIELWNDWAMVPAPREGATWFQAGLPFFYGLRTAGILGQMDAEEAYEEFSGIYALYLSNPQADSLSLEQAEEEPDDTVASSLLRTKGATLCASVAQELWERTDGGKDFDWLLGEIAARYDHFQGKRYSLVDISEILEEATGDSWDRFFEENVRGTSLVLPSSFSACDLFGSESAEENSRELGEEGSGTSWIYLLVGIIFILLIPILLAPYVRRAVKLDVRMPKIIPVEDEEEQEKSAGPENGD